MGRVLIGLGLVLVCLGALVMALERFHIPLGRLPGDIQIRTKSMTFFFPVVTCIVLSVLASLAMWLFNRR